MEGICSSEKLDCLRYTWHCKPEDRIFYPAAARTSNSISVRFFLSANITNSSEATNSSAGQKLPVSYRIRKFFTLFTRALGAVLNPINFIQVLRPHFLMIHIVIYSGTAWLKTGFGYDDRIYWAFMQLVTFHKSLSSTGHSRLLTTLH
jgi:hypothetical protein